MTPGDAPLENPTADPRVAVGLVMAIDVATAELVSSFDEAGVAVILLKGPTTARWLYETSSSRPYFDIDVLVRPSDRGGAEGELRRMGFRYVHADTHSRVWARRSLCVDMHEQVAGVNVDARHAWTVLAGDAERINVAGVDVPILSSPGRALHLALHAAQHGTKETKPLLDLERALTQLPGDVWDAAARLADELGATSSFAAGLRFLPAGAVIAERLRLSHEKSFEAVLRSVSPPPLTDGLIRLRRTRGVAGKARLVLSEVAPAPTFLRASSPVARKGFLGLVAAYLWRPVWLVWRIGPALRAWRRARREAGPSSR